MATRPRPGVLRPCLTCGTPTHGSRCPTHSADYGWAWRRLRAVANQQQWQCAHCGATGKLELDHRIPGTLAGGVQLLCGPCHRAKTDAQRC